MKRILTRDLRIYPLEERWREELFSLKIKAPEGKYDNNLHIQKKLARKRKEISPLPCFLFVF